MVTLSHVTFPDMADPLKKLQSPYSNTTIKRLACGYFHGSFASSVMSMKVEGISNETVLEIAYMQRHAKLFDAVCDARKIAYDLIEDETIVDRIFGEIDIVKLGRLKSPILPESDDMQQFLELFPKTMAENKRLERENYRMFYQIENLMGELEKCNTAVERQLAKRVAEETQELNQKVDLANEEATLMFLELEDVKKLHKVDLSNKNTFDLMTRLQATYKRIDNLKAEINKLRAEFTHYKQVASLFVPYKTAVSARTK